MPLSALPPGCLFALVFVLGACIGSFLNVVILRLPLGKSVVTPGSRCACGQPIAWRDKIPILSWLALRGRARCCGRPISSRYPAVEFLTAALFLACWAAFPPARAVCGMVFLSSLLCAAWIDLDHLVIPDVFSVGLGLAGLALSLLVPALHGEQSGLFALDSLRSGAAGLTGLLIGSGLLLWIALLAEAVLKKEAMGFGDVKLAGAIGAFTGWGGAVFAIFGGAVVGTAWLALVLAVHKLSPASRTKGNPAPVALGAHVPFGPMLAVAAAFYFFAADRWIVPYWERLTGLF